MIVSNAVGGAAGAGSSTSYVIGGNGNTQRLNGAIPDLSQLLAGLLQQNLAGLPTQPILQPTIFRPIMLLHGVDYI